LRALFKIKRSVVQVESIQLAPVEGTCVFRKELTLQTQTRLFRWNRPSVINHTHCTYINFTTPNANTLIRKITANVFVHIVDPIIWSIEVLPLTIVVLVTVFSEK